MRIRKRQAPLPLPSFPPVPLSDPRPIQPSPMVQLTHASSPESSAPLIQQQPEASTALTAFLLDHPRPLPPMAKPEDAGDSSDIVAESGAHDHHAKLDRSDEAGGGRDGGGEKRNDTGKGLLLGSGTLSKALPLSPSNLDGKWCDGEKAIPPKKRRAGRRGDYMMNTTRESNSNTNNNKKMKTKMNKKCTQNDDERNGEEEEEEERKEEVNVDVNTTSKKRGRGSAVMEGSRCSRVNGRGWRCCQQTLVGYSLCEHHLGKGRLRSITSVRSRSIPSTTKNNDSLSLDDDSSCGASSSSPQKKSKYDSSADVDEEHRDEKKPPGVITKKRMKLGMVKARSISSLLGQTNTIVTLHENNQ